ncbi:phage portal protein, partial [Escherichia coli]|nr:phage portal protein [Escherichia coli]
DMIHVKAPMLDMNAFKGIGYFKTLEKQLGLFLAAQSHQNKYFALGSNPIGIIEVDEKMSKEKRENVREAWEQMSQGDKKHRVGVVDAGMKYKPLGFNFAELEMNTLYDNITKQIASVFN